LLAGLSLSYLTLLGTFEGFADMDAHFVDISILIQRRKEIKILVKIKSRILVAQDGRPGACLWVAACLIMPKEYYVDDLGSSNL